TQPLLRTGDALQPLLQVLQDRREAVVLDQEEQLFLAAEVVVEAGQAGPGRPADVADARGVVALLGEHRGRRSQQLLELVVVGAPGLAHVLLLRVNARSKDVVAANLDARRGGGQVPELLAASGRAR